MMLKTVVGAPTIHSRLQYRLATRLSSSATLKDHRSPTVEGSEGSRKQESDCLTKIAMLKNATLTRVPTIPFMGHMFTPYSGAPVLDMKDSYNYWVEMRKKFGGFYLMGFPGVGAGSHGHVYVTADPNEMQKVIRSEGSYPSGVIELMWPWKKALKEIDSSLVQGNDFGLLGRGERWKNHRTFLQKGTLDPRSAKGFVPAISTAAELAALGAPASSDNLELYLNYSSFDMFTSFMFGEFTQTADPAMNTPSNEENVCFCRAAIASMEATSHLMFDPKENFLVNALGFESSQFKEFMSSWNIVWDTGRKKLDAFHTRYNRGELNDAERASYFAGAIERQAEQDPNSEGYVTKEEMYDMCILSLFMGVPATSNVMSWILIHLSYNPKVQDKLYEEISCAVKEVGEGKVTDDVLSRSISPYLHQVVRESIRITPPFASTMFKSNSHREVELHGVTIPKGSIVMLDKVSSDPEYVSDAKEFRPERFAPDAVKGRKDSDMESQMDHPYLRDAFSQGARRCPGRTVATKEILVMVSHLVLKYQIAAPEQIKALDDISHEARPFVQPDSPALEFIPRAL